MTLKETSAFGNGTGFRIPAGRGGQGHMHTEPQLQSWTLHQLWSHAANTHARVCTCPSQLVERGQQLERLAVLVCQDQYKTPPPSSLHYLVCPNLPNQETPWLPLQTGQMVSHTSHRTYKHRTRLHFMSIQTLPSEIIFQVCMTACGLSTIESLRASLKSYTGLKMPSSLWEVQL